MLKLKDFQPANAWVMFSLGVTAFFGMIAPAILPLYFESVATPELSLTQARAYWAYTVAMGLFLIVILAPILGRFADQAGKRKQLLLISTATGTLALSLLVFIGEGNWQLALALYIITAVSAGCSTTLFDSFLVHVAGPHDYDRLSSRAYFNEFLGAGVTLLIATLMIMVVFPGSSWGPRIAFLFAAIWWGTFGFFSIRQLPDAATVSSNTRTQDNSQGRLKFFRGVQKPGQMILFFVALGLSNGGAATINRMATTIGGEVGIGTTELIGALLLRSVIGAAFMWLLSWLAGRYKTKKVIEAGLVLFTLVAFAGYFMLAKWIFWLLAATAALAQGMLIALSRSFFARMVPRARSGEFFGFYYMALFLPAMLGPLSFVQAGQWLDSTRLGILTILAFFILGRIVLTFVDDETGTSTSQQEPGSGLAETVLQPADQTSTPESAR